MLIPMLRNKNIVHKKKKIIDDNNLNFYQKNNFIWKIIAKNFSNFQSSLWVFYPNYNATAAIFKFPMFTKFHVKINIYNIQQNLIGTQYCNYVLSITQVEYTATFFCLKKYKTHDILRKIINFLNVIFLFWKWIILLSMPWVFNILFEKKVAVYLINWSILKKIKYWEQKNHFFSFYLWHKIKTIKFKL